ncbi:drug/metabolite transporter (DMT)-like permease [Texcoconibacillus texcoconensis]|uniref:Drug/metabolite transporter (DMT)-like permease n=2 Tax=Texcoconibacillus texcoconensis TaxID=1095777 RepID=A0A840QV18_9BACI|nr:drug/metabolite transporter (DMT)-like permease [Texcoconibacillus texcoconensis]
MFYAGNILIGKGMNELPPFTIAFFRLLVAFILLLPIGLLAAWRDRKRFWIYKTPFLIMTLTGITFFNTFIYGALQFTSASNVAVLETAIPVMTVILSALLLKEKLRSIQWFGISLSFLGALSVVLQGGIFELSAMNWNIGDAIMIGAIICWAFYSILVKQYMNLFHPFGSLLVMTGISVLILFPFVIVEWSIIGIPSFELPSHLIGTLYLGIFPSFIALVFYNRAVDFLSASRASVFLNFLPIFTMVGAYFWLNETITLYQVFGSLIVIFGVTLTTYFSKSSEESKENIKEEKQIIE